MKKMMIGLAAAGVLLATPALAEGFSFDAPGVHIGVGERPHWRDRDDGWRYRRGYHAYGAGECRDITIRKRQWDGSVVVRHVRRCD